MEYFANLRTINIIENITLDSIVLHIDMESYADQSNHLKDVSCAGTTDSRNGQTIIPSGTTEVAGVDGVARNFALTSDYLDGGDASTPDQHPSRFRPG